MRLVAIAFVRVDGAAGEDPDAAHEPRALGALDQQQLELLRATAQHDDRRRLARLGDDVRLVELLAWGGAVDFHVEERTSAVRYGSPLMSALAKWICESCGYIYDPAEGDPDGGIPAGTSFDDIPDSWFCPVCGARKRDFTPYED